VQMQQKDLDIKCLQEMGDNKDETLRENAATLEQNESEINRLKIEVETSKAAEAQAEQNFEVLSEKDQIIQNLQQKVVDEQEANKQIEDELIQMKIQFDSLSSAKPKSPASKVKVTLNDSEMAKLLKQKEHDIVGLRRAIQQEQDIVAHVQLTQEKEIIEKEREIAVLNAILSQERQCILDREAEIKKLLHGHPKAANGLSPPARPRRTRAGLAVVRVPSRGSEVPSRGGVGSPPATLPSPGDSPRLVTNHQNTLARMIQARHVHSLNRATHMLT